MMTDVGDVGSAWRRLMRLGVDETTITGYGGKAAADAADHCRKNPESSSNYLRHQMYVCLILYRT
jgi:hypothetical protein